MGIIRSKWIKCSKRSMMSGMQKRQKEVREVVSALKKEGKKHLAAAIAANWDKTLLEYSASLWKYRPDMPMETILKQALSAELLRLGYSPKEIVPIVKNLAKRRVLQTTPHIAPAGKPRYFFISWLGALGLKPTDIYPVAMFSGVPFSNKTRPGRLCRKDGDINLMPSAMQDELAYRNVIPTKMLETIENLPADIKKLLPKAKLGASYTGWALTAAQKVEGNFLGGRPIFLDFNEVASNYLLLALQNPEHPVYKIFFSEKERALTIKHFKEMVFFYAPVQKGKYSEMENFYLKDGYLQSASRKIELTPEILAAELKERLCPGLIVGFFIFAFLNRFLCFGSFAQVEYLPLYREKFAKFSFLKKYNIKNAPAGALTTGGFADHIDLYPLDLALQNPHAAKTLLASYEKTLFGDALLAIRDVLLHQNYSMNLVRK